MRSTFLLFLHLLLPSLLAAQAPLVLTDGQDRRPVGRHFQLLEDPAELWTVEEVASPEISDRFEPSGQETVRIDSTSSAYWARLRYRNEADSETRWVLSIRTGQTDHIDFYAALANGGFRVVRTGTALPFASREIADRRFVFHLPSPSGDATDPTPQTIYLRLKSGRPIEFEPVVLTFEKYLHDRQRALLALGIFYGTMLVAIVIHLILFLIVREASYLYYTLFIFVCVIILGIFGGLVQQYLWPAHLALPGQVLLFLLGVSVPLLLTFGSKFLRVKKHLPRVDHVFTALYGLCVLWFVLFPFAPTLFMFNNYRFLALATTMTVVIAGLIMWKKGHRPAMYFSIAWLVFFGSLAIVFSGVLRSTETARDAAFTGLHVSFVLTTFVFALALAERIRWQREQAGMERERLIKELEARNSELERFTYSVSHDLKSPLVTIRGFLGYLKQSAESGDTRRLEEDIARIDEAAASMGNLLSDLLELSRIGRVIHPSETITIEALVGEALDLNRGPLGDLEPVIRIEPRGLTVHGDRIRLCEVFQNLIENALKFMGERPDPRLEIGARAEGECVVCYVKDNGVGISSKYHEKIFDLFARLDAQSEGTGIGLALVKRIVEAHGGSIWVESEGDGSGSTFRIRLPRGAGHRVTAS